MKKESRMTGSSNIEIFEVQESNCKSRFSVTPSQSPLLPRKYECSPTLQRKYVHWSDSLEEVCYIPSRDGFSFRVKTQKGQESTNKLSLGFATYPKSVLKRSSGKNDKQRREQDLSLVDELLAELV